MKTFTLNRVVDETGVSGTGNVAQGVVFDDGTAVLRWLTDTPGTTMFPNVEAMMKVHGHAGKTQLVYSSGPAQKRESKLQLAKGRFPPQGAKRERKLCGIVGCKAYVKAQGMCPLHYSRKRKGQPMSRSTVIRQSRETVIAKVDKEKRVVYGVVLDPYIVDAHDDWIPPNDVEETAHNWLAASRKMKLQHETPLSAVPVESYVMPYPTDDDYRKAVKGEPHRIYRFKLGSEWVHSGSWVLGTKVLDESAWDQVTSGELGAYSIGGMGVRREMEKIPMPEVQILTVEAPP